MYVKFEQVANGLHRAFVREVNTGLSLSDHIFQYKNVHVNGQVQSTTACISHYLSLHA